jgi:membrane fusion protein (multidrug efflux system)
VLDIAAEPELPDTFDLPAVVEPNRTVTVSAEVAGRIERLPLKEGHIVAVEDLLVELDDDLIRPQFEMAEAQYERDRIEFERMEILVADDATSQSDLDDATNRVATSKAQLAEMRARLDRTRILAPAHGVLNDLLVEVGEYVQPGTPVANVVDTATVRVVVDVPERDVAFFEIGQSTEIHATVRGQPEPTTGTITFISELADQRTRTTRMEITVDNRKNLLRSGQIVQAHLTRQVLKNIIMIPLQAVIPMEDGKAVYVVKIESATAQRRDVELGLIKGDRVQVTQGLAPGERLIVAGHRFVADGQNINIAGESN